MQACPTEVGLFRADLIGLLQNRQLWVKGHRGLGVLDTLLQKEQILTELTQIYCHGKEDYLIRVSEFWRDQVKKKR